MFLGLRLLIVAATTLTLTGPAFADAVYSCVPNSNQDWASATIDTHSEQDTHGRVEIAFKDGSALSVPLLEYAGQDGDFSAAGRVGRQRLSLELRAQACEVDGQSLPYRLRMQRNGQPMNGCCSN